MRILPFMVREGEQRYVTENYVSIPPALVITDEAGNIWTLGFRFGPILGGEYTFNVLRNGIETGDFASRIECRNGQVKLKTPNGWRNVKTVRQPQIFVYAIGAKIKKSTDWPDLIRVTVYFDARPDIPMVSFCFNTALGGMHEMKNEPLVCEPNQWLYATTDRPCSDLIVAGYLGNQNIREIPIRERTV